MQIIKPNKLSLIHKAYQFGKVKSFSVGVLSFFSLGRQSDLILEYLAWPKIMPLLQSGAILDMGFPKPSAEMLLAGNAYAPKAQQVKQLEIQARIGEIKKRLCIVGDRTWNGKKGSKPTEAIPFSQMPLNYAHAFGGVGFAQNPYGRAYAGKDPILLPNIYYAGQEHHVYQKKLVEVAGFSPLDITWPERSQHNGTYDKKWQKNTFPGFPLDTNRRLFQAAPLDQQCQGWIAPNAPYEIQGMHPTQETIAGHLPGIVARVFVQLQGKSGPTFVEATTVIDTVWFFPEAEIGVAIHRGEVAIADSDALDVEILMLACESMQDKPRELEYYRKVMSLRSNPETALAHTLHESQLLPQKSATEKARIQTLYAKAKQEQVEREASIRAHYQKQIKDKCLMEISEPEESQESNDVSFDPIPQELLMSGDVDLSPLLAQVQELGERKLAELKAKMAELEKQQKEDAAQQEPQEEVRESLEDMRLRVFSPVYVQAQDLVAKDPGPLMVRSAPMLEAMAELPTEQQTAETQNLAEALKTLDRTKREGRQHAPDPMAPEHALPKEGALQIREWVKEFMQQGQSLAGRDLAGADLHGLDFSHQDLRDVMFEKANLDDCVFTGCRLDGAVFTAATLIRAKFCNAKLTHTNFSRVEGECAEFAGAELSHVMMSHAQFSKSNWSDAVLAHLIAPEVNLSGATLDGVRCTDTVFHQSILEGSHWKQAQCERCIFLKSNLKNSIWTASKLIRCMMIDAKAEGIRMDHAQWQKVQCSNVGDFRGANMDHARMEVCGFRGVDLSQASATHTVFMECDFGNSVFFQASLTDSLFFRCMMMQACVKGANMHKSIFQEGSMRKVQFKNSTLTEVLFSHMDMSEVALHQCNTRGMKQCPVSSLA